jgi:plastocyanin
MTILLIAAVAGCGGGGGTGPTGTTTPPAGGGGGGGGGGTTPPATPTVTVGANTFSPDNMTVGVGQTVTWKWDTCSSDPYGYGGSTCVQHTVTFDVGNVSSGTLSEGTYARTFTAAGTYTYYCQIHGKTYMSGSIIVK